MAARLCILFALVACSSAAFVAAPGYAPGIPAVTSQHSNILRSYGNLGQVSTYSKTIDTPFSSVSKSDVRVSNPGYAHGIVAPAYAHGLAAPAYAHGIAAPAYAHGVAAPGLLGVAYSAAPAVTHMTYSNGLGFNYAW